MKMVVTTKEAFELTYKREKTMFAQEAFAPRSSPDLHPRLAALAVAFNAAGFCQIQSQ